MQFLTSDYLPSTMHKVGLNTSERYAFAYFHEPNFSSLLTPLSEFQEGIHYGTHFTNMCMRNYSDRVTAKRIRSENRIGILDRLRENSRNRPMGSVVDQQSRDQFVVDPAPNSNMRISLTA